MPSLLQSSWLIPGTPLLGAVFIGVLLASFSRTMNRLTKPVSILMIICLFVSISLSLSLYLKHLEGNIYLLDDFLKNYKFRLGLYINSKVEITLIVSSLAMFLVTLYSYLSLERRIGYVRYIVILGTLSSLIFSMILSRDLFNLMSNKFILALNQLSLYG